MVSGNETIMTEKLSRPMYIIIFLMIVVKTEGGLQTLDSECVDLNYVVDTYKIKHI